MLVRGATHRDLQLYELYSSFTAREEQSEPAFHLELAVTRTQICLPTADSIATYRLKTRVLCIISEYRHLSVDDAKFLFMSAGVGCLVAEARHGSLARN